MGQRALTGRTALLAGLVAVLVVAALVAAVRTLSGGSDGRGERAAGAPQGLPGPVLLVPGYGGSTGGLEVLAGALRAQGRTATVVPLPGDGTGDLREAAAAVGAAVDAALAAGAPSVDLVGYSAGGITARIVVRDRPEVARRVVTLGSPHAGTRVAALGLAFAPGACQLACRQLVPGSPLLEELAQDDPTPGSASWLSLWTTQDTVVTPPATARLEGAVNLALQDLCPGLRVDHAGLPTAPVVQDLVLRALGVDDAAPTPASCAA